MKETVAKDKSIKKFAPIIGHISSKFDIPQLQLTRRIWALLPHDYFHSTKRYPVLYLQDAQNLFDEKAPFGNWGIDKHMERLSHDGIGDLIIIAIDHGGRERISEYSPYYHRKFGEGKGHLYAEFIINTLKPFVDKYLRTKPERDYTGIGGSSMGGLISAYIGVVHAAHFSKVMIFSPSFWYSDEIYFDAFKYDYTYPSRIFVYGGELESEYMAKHIKKFQNAVDMNGYPGAKNEWKVVINPKGHHTERDWNTIFPQAVQWLYFPKTISE